MNDRPIVFLHIPKTAGQTIHNELSRVVGANRVSPVRVHTQAGIGGSQMPPGYGLYSGHLDWGDVDSLPNPFTFSVLRDPKERIASFYFYLLKEAQSLSEAELGQPENHGKKRILACSASDYFFAGDAVWRRFIHDHFDNFYCSYFATRMMRGWRDIAGLTRSQKLRLVFENLEKVNRMYHTQNLQALEADLEALLGQKLRIANTFVNAGSMPQNTPRWPRMVACLDSDKDIAALHEFTETDHELMQRLRFPC